MLKPLQRCFKKINTASYLTHYIAFLDEDHYTEFFWMVKILVIVKKLESLEEQAKL